MTVTESTDQPIVKPLRPRVKAATALLVGVVAVALYSLSADLTQLDVVSRIADGERVSLQEATDSDDKVAGAATIYLVVGLIAGITFLLWWSRIYRNIVPLGVERPRWGARWAVAYWLIPIISLFRPKQVANDIWRGSDPDAPAGSEGWESRPVTPLLNWWWALFILDMFIGNFAIRSAFDSDTPDELVSEATAYVITDIADAALAILTIVVIWAMTRRQEARIAKLTA